MKILHITLGKDRYKASYAFWSGIGLGTIPCDDPILANIHIYQNTRVYVYQAPWFVKTNNLGCEAIMLVNDTFDTMRVTVNGNMYIVQGKSTIVVPESIVLSPAFVELCHDHAIYDIKDASKVYVTLSKLTWASGINAYMEAIC